MKKNILIISRATFPNQSPRSMRTDELAKELARQGHNVTLYVLTGDYDYDQYKIDTNINIKSLGETYFSQFDPVKGSRVGLVSRGFMKIFGKYTEFPEIELIRNTYSVLNRELTNSNKQYNLLLTIGFPHTIHWGAAVYKKIYPNSFVNTTWIADCGDPFMGNPFRRPPSYFKYFEKLFCRQVDYITVPTQEAIEAYYKEFHYKIKVIPQGFSNIEDTSPIDFEENTPITFLYAGTFYKDYRDPKQFLEFLKNTDNDFIFKVFTNNIKFINDCLNELDFSRELKNKIIISGFIPREDILKEMRESDFVINFENPSKVQSPSKLIDYALSGRPILSIDTNTKLNKELINQFFQRNYSKALVIDNISQYDIKNVAHKFLQLVIE